MLNIPFRRNSHLHKLLSDQGAAFSIGSKSPEEKVRLLIVRDLMRLGWEITFKKNSVLITPPASWRMRVIRTAADILGFDSDFLLKHSFQREIYAVPLAQNFKEFLQGKERSLEYSDYPLDDLIAHWKKRWLTPRKENAEVMKNVIGFHAQDFAI